jgi:tetratricopeptide (TPR) repeat protein
MLAKCRTIKIRLFSLLFPALILSTPLHAISLKNIDDLIERGSYQRAYVEMLEMKQKKSTARLLYKLGQTLEKLQDFPTAMIYYQEVVSSFPGSVEEVRAKLRLSNYFSLYKDEDLYTFHTRVELFLNRGLKELAKKNYHKAILYLKQALDRRRDLYLIHFNLGVAYFELQKLNPEKEEYLHLAIRYYLGATSIRPSAKAFNNLACIFAMQADEVLAHVYFRKALTQATEPMKMSGILRVIAENLDYFSNNESTQKLKILRELLP